MVTGVFSPPAGIDSACGPILITPPAGPTVCVAVAVAIGVQPSRPVACRSEPIRSACGAGAGPSGGSPQPGGAGGARRSAAPPQCAAVVAVLAGPQQLSSPL